MLRARAARGNGTVRARGRAGGCARESIEGGPRGPHRGLREGAGRGWAGSRARAASAACEEAASGREGRAPARRGQTGRWTGSHAEAARAAREGATPGSVARRGEGRGRGRRERGDRRGSSPWDPMIGGNRPPDHT
jgi:hypothetical protein